jgi:serine/threonine-protein phosphatase 2B catalytic subunit
MWADPTLEPHGDLKGLQVDNVERGCSYIFGRELTEDFLRENHIRCIIRGHQAEEKGYRLFNWASEDSFPRVITIFSAPNYCDFYNNKGACLRISEKEFLLEQYS